MLILTRGLLSWLNFPLSQDLLTSLLIKWFRFHLVQTQMEEYLGVLLKRLSGCHLISYFFSFYSKA